MSETQQEQHPPIHGTPERAIIKNDGIAQDIADQIQQVSEKKDAIMGKVITKGDSQEAPNFEEVPAWAASFQQTMKDMAARLDAIEMKTKGGVPAEDCRTTEAKDATGQPAASADNGEPAGGKFESAERAEERGEASFAGMGESPATASQSEQEHLERSRGAGPTPSEKEPSLENGVINMTTSGQPRHDLRGHDYGNGEMSRQADALMAKQAAEIAELRSRINRLSKQPTIDERNMIAAARRRADGIYTALNRDMPEVLPGESPSAYRRRLADGLKDLSPSLKTVVMDSLPEDVFGLTEERIYQDAIEATKRPDVVPPMQLRAHQYQDSTGHLVTEYFGDNLAWMAPFMAPGHVSRINKQAGKVH